MEQTPLPVPPQILTGDELYDLIMREIEPDLLNAELPKLTEKYANDTEEQKKARSERYGVALQEYKKRLELYKEDWNEKLRIYQRDLVRHIEAHARHKEDQVLASLEASLNAA